MKKIQLSQGKFAIVDDDDFEKLAKYRWYYQAGRKTQGYARRSELKHEYKKDGKRRRIWMHRSVLITKLKVDHINGNTLDNRKSNLRAATQRKQTHNRRVTTANKNTGFKGVRQNIGRKHPYEGVITFRKKRIYLGCFYTAKEAAIAYDQAALKYFGEFACLNFPK